MTTHEILKFTSMPHVISGNFLLDENHDGAVNCRQLGSKGC